MKWFAKQLIKVKEEILGLFGLLGLGISFTAPDIASLVILFGSAFLILMGVLKVMFGIKLPLIRYLEPLIKPLRAIKFAENPTKSGEEIGTIILDVDKKIGGTKMREKIKGFLKHQLIVNKFSNGSYLVIIIALALFVANQYLGFVENVDMSAYLGAAVAIAAFISRKLKPETIEEYDERSAQKEYNRKQKEDEKKAMQILKDNDEARKKRELDQAVQAIRNKEEN